MCPFPQQKQSGFSLLELVTVLLIITVLSTIAIRSTVDIGYSVRYEQTRDRYESIKKAIVGNPNKFINGLPDLAGFTSDVGRLPFALQELLDGNHCVDTQYFTQSDCDTNIGAGSWLPTPGWNGPYLDINSNASDIDAYTDGWGNTGTGNYGWFVSYLDSSDVTTTTLANVESMIIQSGGKNQVINVVDTDYDQDYPPTTTSATLSSADWQVTYSDFSVSLIPPAIFTECNITSIPTQNACDAAQGSWNDFHCEDTVNNTSALCGTAGLTWNATYLVCEDNTNLLCNSAGLTWKSGPCNRLNTQPLCESTSWRRWDGANCLSTSKAYCDSYYVVTSYTTQAIDLIIDGAVASTATVNENGVEQIIPFSGVSLQTMGNRTLLISKSGTNDIYPPSCLGLDGDTDANTQDDCTDALGTLLTNNVCDDITIAECEAGAGGTGVVTRKVLSIPFIPYKQSAMINW